jgi:hypothetical protein
MCGMRSRFLLFAAFVVGVVGACGSSPAESPPITTTTTTTTRATASTTSSTSTTTAPPACSAAGLSPDVAPQAGLPAAVVAMRADLARAAARCDYDELARLADRGGAGVRFSFGGSTDPVAFWKKAEAEGGEPRPLRALRVLLDLPFGTVEPGASVTLYAWPRLHTVTQPSDALLNEVAATGLYSIEILRSFVAAGSGYLGYRVIIGADGDWQAFVAGD